MSGWRALRGLAAVAVVAAGVARADVVNGVQLPDGAVKVGENRYRVKEDFEGILKYYRTAYPIQAFPRRQIVNQPGVKAVHITNPGGKSFEGLNIYLSNDEVRIYVIPPVDGPKPGKKRGGDSTKKRESR
ncbi:MAG TPA: hypothetical protein VIG99_24050 [Myxococcaceae bacterium]